MMPLALIVAINGSVSNHCSRNSAALMVMSWTNTDWWYSDRSRKLRARPSTPNQSRGSIRPGSGGTIDRTGLMNRAMSTISRPYSSYASASVRDQRRSSRMVSAWSFTRQR